MMPQLPLDNMRLAVRTRRSPNVLSVGDVLDYTLGDPKGHTDGTLTIAQVYPRLIGWWGHHLPGDDGFICFRLEALR